MSSDNWNDIYLNGFGRDIDWDCCPVTSGIAIAVMHARKVAIDIGREVYLSKHPALPNGERYYRVTTKYPEDPFNNLVAKVYPGGRTEYRKQIDEATHD